MESRLVIFILFLTGSAIILSLTGYKKYFTKDENLSQILAKSQEAPQSSVEDEEQISEENESGEIVLSTPALKNGYKIYHETGECVRCHGDQGQGNVSEEGPLLAGQYDWYVEDQITQVKNGERKNEKMKPFVANLSEKDIKDVASYIALLRVK
jgi:cytochrome c553